MSNGNQGLEGNLEMKYSMTQELYDNQYAHQDENESKDAEYQVDYDP